MDNDTLITQRLGELKRKQDFTARQLAQTKKGTHIMPWVSAAAAVLILAIIASVTIFRNPFDGIVLDAPDFTEYRGSQASEIEYCIQAGDWSSALAATEAELGELRPFSADGIADEEREYLDALYKNRLEELQWTRIYLLVKLEDREAVLDACDTYLALDPPADRRASVENLIEKL